MDIRRIVLLAALGLAPIVVAIAVAAADVSRSERIIVTSSSAVYAGDYAGRPAVVAFVPAEVLPRLRAGQPAEIFIPTLDVRVGGSLTTVSPVGAPLPPGLDPAWLSDPSARSYLASVVVTLDIGDPRLTPGTSAGVRITTGDG